MPKLATRLTVRDIESGISRARKTKTSLWLSDSLGLILKIEASGTAKYWLRYRHPATRRQAYRFIGSHSAQFSLAEARAAADKVRELLRQGLDPNEVEAEARRVEQAAKAAEEARITVTDLFERWAAVDLIHRKDGGKEVRRMFQKDVLPILGSMAVADVRKGHITGVVDAITGRGVTRMVKLIFSLMRQMFRFAVDRDIIENDPTASIRKAKIGGKDIERDRVLSEDEIRLLHQKIEAARLFKPTEIAVWLALGTCCRIGELLHAEWKHVRLDVNEWFIPKENSKNGRPHTVYLSPFAARYFAELQTLSGNTAWCFPNRTHTASVSDKTVTKQIGDRQRGSKSPMSRRSPYTDALSLPGGKWTPHDLRRTGATMMTALGVIPEVAEKCLNHTEESRVKRTYQRHSYEKEKREAWRLLGERLEVLVAGGGACIIPFRNR